MIPQRSAGIRKDVPKLIMILEYIDKSDDE
jgi:hypothetical protein